MVFPLSPQCIRSPRWAHVLFSLSLLLFFSSAKAISLSPNTNGGSGAIPSGYDVVDFHTYDANWRPTITLPAKAKDAAVITVTSHATYDSSVSLANTDLSAVGSFVLLTGDTLGFDYNAKEGIWRVRMSELNKTPTGGRVPTPSAKLSRYTLSSADLATVVQMPASGVANALLAVRSTSKSLAWVSSANLLFGSTLALGPDEEYVFSYRADLGRWYLVKSPPVVMDARKSLFNGWLARVVRPLTEIKINQGDRVDLTLPLIASDRDRIRITSASDEVSTIANAGIDYDGTLKILRGDTYELMWIAQNNRWNLLRSPIRQLSTGDLRSLSATTRELPALTAPATRLSLDDGSWISRIALPSEAAPGDRLHVSSSATKVFDIVSGSASAGFSSYPITPGDVLTFRVDSARKWQLETERIDILSVYSDGVVARLGEQAAKARQIESFRLTNEALENSRVNFRVKMVGMLQIPNESTTLGTSLRTLRDNATVQSKRKALKANSIYYEGVEEGCGLAWLGELAYNMVATGSLNCGTTVMRHEFGHNMGLKHNGEVASPPYARGYGVVPDIMGGNAIPFYSSPLLYDYSLGIPMGSAETSDSVRRMNERLRVVKTYF